MNNPVLSKFCQITQLSEQARADFSEIVSVDHFPKNTALLEIGKHARSMFYIHQGLARAFYYHDGKDVTDYFAIDGQFIGAVPSLFTGQPSQKGIHLIEAAEVYYFEATKFEACCSRHHDLEHAARIITSLALLDEQERIESLRFYSVKERYDLMEKKYPGIMNRSPLHYVASYLGTSQVSISRIRAGVQ